MGRLLEYRAKGSAMKKEDVKINGVYWARVSGRRVPVRIMGFSGGGYYKWEAVNLKTGRTVGIRTAGRLTAMREGEKIEN